MGASNFHNVNASKVFAIAPENEESFDSIDYEYIIEDITENLKELNEKKDFWFREKYGNDQHELRSYPSTVLGTLQTSKEYAGIEVVVSLTAILRSGYYEGTNLDWSLAYEINGDDRDLEYFSDAFEYHANLSRKKAIYLSAFAEKWAEKTKDKMVDMMEDIFNRLTTPLVKVATFSNGETIYQKADTLEAAVNS